MCNAIDLSDIISIIALICSVTTFILNLRVSKMNRAADLEAVYFKEIFMNYLIKEIPINSKYIRFDNGKLSDFNKLVGTLDKMKSESAYFGYIRKDFYKELKKLCEDLEDYLINTSNHKVESIMQADIYNEINAKIIGIYKIISENYRRFSG